jgi:hypothetical protein
MNESGLGRACAAGLSYRETVTRDIGFTYGRLRRPPGIMWEQLNQGWQGGARTKNKVGRIFVTHWRLLIAISIEELGYRVRVCNRKSVIGNRKSSEWLPRPAHRQLGAKWVDVKV